MSGKVIFRTAFVMLALALLASGQADQSKPMFSLTLGGRTATGMRDFMPGCIGTPPSLRSGSSSTGSASRGPNKRRRYTDSRRRVDSFFDISYRMAPGGDEGPGSTAAHTWVASRYVDGDSSWSDLYDKFKSGTTAALEGSVVYADSSGTALLSATLRGVTILSHTPVAVASKTNRKGTRETQVIYEELEFVVSGVEITTTKIAGNPDDSAAETSTDLDFLAGGGSQASRLGNFGRVRGGTRRFDTDEFETRDSQACVAAKDGRTTCSSSTQVTAGSEVGGRMEFSVPVEGFLEDVRQIVNSNNDTHQSRWNSVVTMKNKEGKALGTMTYKENTAVCVALPAASDNGNVPTIHAMSSAGRRRNSNRRRSLPVETHTNFGFLEITRG